MTNLEYTGLLINEFRLKKEQAMELYEERIKIQKQFRFFRN
jgi:hypothetical protein